ncbi:CDP-glycerol glycerophosphotransferase [Pedococcus dokdonensis]|uniref:CDP-glycerol glycerophosphotransferase n=1 Tax=Pedococcus dokdonensis TaxID=443156 RepID=A0A1H0RHB5_9MICO|nr:glycosyltransferase [Pedococcus dokdonensis]SDP28963.1 CDP-glycerol glycerophosphotransferase [Pedococcus dokdonensis]
MTAQPGGTPLLSVVVAVYDVERWVRECLESIAQVVPRDTEVIIIDDGSTDASPAICDAFAADRPGWKVVHQSNAGLGAARNVGIDLATGEYVGFVDGDDVLMPAYADLVRRAVVQGVHVATGAVNRTDGERDWPSGLHARALQDVGDRVVLVDDPSLIYDTTAWNKVYRRSFLAEHGLRFPEGVLYEDLPVTVRALHFAGPVAVVHEPVYRWRSRQGERSITQRRNELVNLTDRFAAVRDVDEFLETQQLLVLREHHDAKVLQLDLPLYTAALPESDEAYRAAYLTFFRHVVAGLPQSLIDAEPPTLRLYVTLAAAGRMDDLVKVVRARRGRRAWADDDRGHLARARDNLASFAIERDAGPTSTLQLVWRATTSTLKALLPDWAKQRVAILLGRLRRQGG